MGQSGFVVSDRPSRVAQLGIEVDAEAINAVGRVYWCEFKGSWVGDRPGLRRTDTVKKALANAYLLHHAAEPYPSLLLITSHLPKPGSAGDLMLGAALVEGAVYDVICLNNADDVARLTRLGAGYP